MNNKFLRCDNADAIELLLFGILCLGILAFAGGSSFIVVLLSMFAVLAVLGTVVLHKIAGECGNSAGFTEGEQALLKKMRKY